MSGTLFVVATPIGNLEDVTLRALRVLRTVDLIAAEDTRRTARLLAHHGISTPTLSFHQHNTRGRVPQLVARLQQGASIALVTDAGTPGVSDPGVELVSGLCRRSESPWIRFRRQCSVDGGDRVGVPADSPDDPRIRAGSGKRQIAVAQECFEQSRTL